MPRWILLALLPACVSTLDVPRQGPCEDTLDCREGLVCIESTCEAVCDSASCSPFRCDSETNGCFETCETDAECTEVGSCEGDVCMSACEVLGCEDGFACNAASGACYELCYTDDECDGSYLCCNDAAIGVGSCGDAEWGNCYP